jgi:UDP-glucose 4-epimerase
MKSEATDVNLNVGTGIKTTIKELVDTLLEETESDIEPEYIADAQMFVTHRVGSTELAEELTGFKAELPYREGLRSVIEWRRSDQARALA